MRQDPLQNEIVLVHPSLRRNLFCAELPVNDCPIGQSVGQERDEELGDDIPQNEKAPVLQFAPVSFLMYQHCIDLSERRDCFESQADVV